MRKASLPWPQCGRSRALCCGGAPRDLEQDAGRTPARPWLRVSSLRHAGGWEAGPRPQAGLSTGGDHSGMQILGEAWGRRPCHASPASPRPGGGREGQQPRQPVSLRPEEEAVPPQTLPPGTSSPPASPAWPSPEAGASVPPTPHTRAPREPPEGGSQSPHTERSSQFLPAPHTGSQCPTPTSPGEWEFS